MVSRWFTCITAVISVLIIVALHAQESVGPTATHMMIADPASLSGARAEAVYQSIRPTLRRHFI